MEKSEALLLLQEMMINKAMDEEFEAKVRELIIIDPNELLLYLWASCTTSLAFKSETSFWNILQRASHFSANPEWHDFFYMQPNMFA